VEFGKTTALKPNMLFGRQHGALWQHKANLPPSREKPASRQRHGIEWKWASKM